MRGFKSILRKSFEFLTLFLIFVPMSFFFLKSFESIKFRGFKINDKTRFILLRIKEYAFKINENRVFETVRL